MRGYLVFLALICAPALAQTGDTPAPARGPVPEWVKPVAAPATSSPDDAPLRFELVDQQVKFEPGAKTVYTRSVMHLQTPQGLAAGNISLAWNPSTDQLTIHSVLIHRDGKDIDVLAAGKGFTVVRREANLENAMLDGVLTANLQAEGLRVGDKLELVYSLRTSDPSLKGHVEQLLGAWNGVSYGRAHLRASWPSSFPIQVRQTASLPPIAPVREGQNQTIELQLDDVKPIIPPRGAPARYSVGRLVELSDFKSWAELGALMAPLYAQAARIPPAGQLRDEVESIKAASADPVKRAQAALALVQDQVRYVALVMGTGGYVPASAEETWARRFGDCKAKTALLLALLHELGIAADPVAVNITGGDGVDALLPMITVFNHVLVRADIAGKSYWLDGTRSADSSLERMRVPAYDWGLPLVASKAALVRMLPEPLTEPDDDLVIDIDASNGLTMPAPFKLRWVQRGDQALGMRFSLAAMSDTQRDTALRSYWRDQFDFVEITAVDARFDRSTGEEIMTMSGTASLEWKDGWYEMDRAYIGYDADFARADGPDKAAPFAVSYPSYSRAVETIKLPPGYVKDQDLGDKSVDETLAGIAYRRTVAFVDGSFKVERTIRAVAPEFPASEAPAAQKRLRELADNRVHLKRTDSPKTSAELDALAKTMPKDFTGYFQRGYAMLRSGRFEAALADFDKAVELKPKDPSALAFRSMAHSELRDYQLAQEDAAAAAAIDPKNRAVLDAQAQIAVSERNYDNALDPLDAAIAANPQDFRALFQRSAIRLQLGDLDGALKDMADGLTVNPTFPAAHALYSRMLLQAGRNDDAEAALRAMEQLPGADPMMLQSASLSYAVLGRREDALRLLDRAIAMASSPMSYVFHAEIRERKDIAGRAQDIDKAIALEPASPIGKIAKAQLFVETGDFQGAIGIYSSILDAKAKDVETRTLRGIAYSLAGQNDMAEADFSMARGKTPSAETLAQQCVRLSAAGAALDKALADCDAALAKNPGEPAFMDSRAFVLLRLGRLDEAIAQYDAALAKKSDLAASLYGRAVAWSRKGDMAKAQADRAAAIRKSYTIAWEFSRNGITF